MTRFLRSILSSAARAPAAHLLLLAALNAFICRKLFVTEYTRHMGSIEAAYIGLSRWIMEHPFDLDWFPLWYGGIPFQNAYPPLLHLLVAAVAALAGISPALAHHAVTAAMYSLGPLALYWLARRLSASHAAGLTAGLLYSLTSPSAILAPVIARDMGTMFGPRRLHALVQYGEGPHIMSLTLLPLALIALDHALARRKPLPVYLAALALAAVVLTNWLGAFALASAALAYLLATWNRGWRGRLLTAAAIAVLAYAIASPWIPPSTLAAIRRNAQFTVGHYPLGPVHALYALLLAAVLASVVLAARKWNLSPPARFGAYFFVMMGAIALTGYWFGIYLLPQPERYHLEMEMGAVLLAACAGLALWRRLPAGARRVAGAALACLAALLADGAQYRARNWTQPVDIAATIEYQVGRWFAESPPASRVFATGSIKFWHNAFASTPQLGGGFDQGIVNPMIPRVTFGIPYTLGDGARCGLWMRAYGIDRIVASGPNSRDAYRDYRDAAKFAGVFRELWRSGDDVVYAVPRRSPSLAHVIRRSDIVPRAPANLEDVEPLAPYHASLEDPGLPTATIAWPEPGRAAITAATSPDQVLSVQVTYHPGWRASVGGRTLPVAGDGLGQIILDPGCPTPCTVDLVFDGGREMALARFASAGAFLLGAAWFAASRRRARRRV